MIDLSTTQVHPVGEMVTVRKPRLSATILAPSSSAYDQNEMPPAELGVIQQVGDGYPGPDGEMVPLVYEPGDVVLLTFGTGAPIPGCPGGYLVPAQAVVAKISGVDRREHRGEPRPRRRPRRVCAQAERLADR